MELASVLNSVGVAYLVPLKESRPLKESLVAPDGTKMRQEKGREFLSM